MQPIRTYVITGMLIILGIALVALLALAAWYLRTVFLYIIIAAILTMITRPLEKRMERVRIKKWKIPRGLRALSILLGIYLLLFCFVAIFIPLFMEEAKILSTVDSQQLSAALHEPLVQLEQAFATIQPAGSNGQTLEQYVQGLSKNMLNMAQVSSIANQVVIISGQLIIAFFAISFFTFFFLKDGPVIFEMLLLLVPAKHLRRTRNIIDDTQVMLSKYFTGVLIDVLFVATFVSSGMALLGVKNALIIGFFAGVMNIIPYVGPLIGGAFAIVIGVSTNLHLDFYGGLLPLIGKISLVFVLMNLIDGFAVQPYIFSKRVKAHPIEIFAVILIAGTLAGVGGMIVAVPVYTVLRIIAKEYLSHKNRFVKRLTDELEEITEGKP